MMSDYTNVERFVDLHMKMDDLHQSDFREMRLESKGNFDIAHYAVIGTDLDAYLRQFIAFYLGVWLCQFYGRQLIKSFISHLRNFIALILEV